MIGAARLNTIASQLDAISRQEKTPERETQARALVNELNRSQGCCNLTGLEYAEQGSQATEATRADAQTIKAAMGVLRSNGYKLTTGDHLVKPAKYSLGTAIVGAVGYGVGAVSKIQAAASTVWGGLGSAAATLGSGLSTAAATLGGGLSTAAATLGGGLSTAASAASSLAFSPDVNGTSVNGTLSSTVSSAVNAASELNPYVKAGVLAATAFGLILAVNHCAKPKEKAE